mmetsp:Transcript_3916/g.4592  ORF Transcript_3916/g.4592 Transcript_3916/m.4592 type:complete len:102 (-) Transcript_3916:74-379(-)
MKRLSYDDHDFDEEGLMTLNAVLEKGMVWKDLQSIINIQFRGSSEFFGVKNETNNLYPFMLAATIDGMRLEILYHLAMYDPKLVYELCFEIDPPRKRARNV